MRGGRIEAAFESDGRTDFMKKELTETRRADHFGNGEAALFLYRKTLSDKTGSLSELDYDSPNYWLRIGAQNGNGECIRIYSELLTNSPDPTTISARDSGKGE